MALQFHEYFARIPVPETLKGKLINTEVEPIEFIENLSKINVFVGPNNSGKSYLLRELVLIQNIFPNHYSPLQLQKLNQIIEKAQVTLDDLLKEWKKDEIFVKVLDSPSDTNYSGNYFNQIFPELLSPIRYITLASQTVLEVKVKSLTKLRYSEVELRPNIHEFAEQRALKLTAKYKEFISELNNIINRINAEFILKVQGLPIKAYCHFHRTLLNKSIGSAFIGSLKNQYFKYRDYGSLRWDWTCQNELAPHILNFDEKYFFKGIHLETGTKIFDDILSLSRRDKRRLNEFEKFLSKEFFDSKEITIHATDEDESELKIIIGEEKERWFYELGTGIQMIIILTFPLFKYDNGIIIVEEPELFVHPGLQKQLMKIYATHERAENFMFFIATHSNHILDTTLYDNQISIFSVKKSLEESTSDPKFILQNLAHGDDNALTQLGVSNSSVFLANCTIWVEGVTDRMYIQKFMEVYAEKYEAFKRFKEGVHYSFVYSGGSNIDHYDFDQEGSFLKDRESPAVKYFCGKAFVVVDKDNTEDEKQAWKQKRNEKLKEILGENQFEQLEVREIENLLSLKTVCNTVRSYPTWAKTKELTKEQLENNQEAFKNSKIGEFIDEILFPLLKTNETDKRAKHFKAESGTINDKTEFASKAIQHIDKSSMTTEAEELVAKIYAFIESQNRF